ncbi:MAG TPA: type II toxin-antitoxin system VapC family toxin, partial [Acidisarcina sp.]
MKVLLDTHALLWATLSPASLSTTARKIIADPKNIILVSAASAWEISIKVKRGKLPLAEAFERDFIQ